MLEKIKKFFTTIPGKITIIAFLLVLIGILVYQFYYKNLFLFYENENLFLDGVKEYLERNPSELPSEGEFREFSLMDMYKMEYLDSLYVPGKDRVCSEDGFVRVINKDNNYTYLVSITCGKYKSKIDSTDPIITLNGDDTIVLHLGDEYQELGVDAVYDNQDKLKVEDVKIDTSKLDLTKTGTYSVTYTIYDNTYNMGQVQREVIVADTLSGKIEREKGNDFVFKGNAGDNYVLFSGMLFRVVKVNSDGTTVLITDNNISNLTYSTGDTSYLNSNVYTWLNEYFYNHISSSSKKYLVSHTWCYDTQGSVESANHCQEKVDAKVGLLSLTDLLNSIENNKSYLLDGFDFMLLNSKNETEVWATSMDDTASLVATNSKEILTGIRPVIVLRSDICITSGTGTYDSPYKLQDYNYGKENEQLRTRFVGEYVYYSGYPFRISKVFENGQVELTLATLLQNQTSGNLLLITYDETMKTTPNVEEDGNFYNQLNNKILAHVSETQIVKSTYKIPKIDASRQYKDLETVDVTSLLSVPASYEIFSGVNKTQPTSLYYLADYQDDLVSFINGSNGLGFQLTKTTYASKGIKIKLTLRENIKISSGKGTVNSPYYVK